MNDDNTSVVDQIAAPSEPVKGSDTSGAQQPTLAALLWQIADLVNHYCLLPFRELAMVVACWVLETFCYDEFDFCGYLAPRSPTPRCGKTRLLRLVGQMVKGGPVPITNSPTAAVLYRRTQAVLLVDEVDHLRNRDKDIFGQVIAVFNSGFERGGVVERSVWNGKDWEVKQF